VIYYTQPRTGDVMRILSICVLMRNLSIVQIHRMRQNSDTAMT